MSTATSAHIALAALTLSAAPAALHGAATPSAPERACDVRLNAVDQDPAGLNVRAAPGGAVVGTLKARDAWIQVHVTGQAGDWMRIDRAVLYDDGLPNGEQTVFRGRGFVHISKLAFESLNPGAAIRARPGEAGPPLWRAPQDEDRVPKAQLVGCAGEYAQVKAGGVTGWTRSFCSNQRTTCG